MSHPMPIELRPLRSLLNRLADQHPDAAVSPTVIGWCEREQLVVPTGTTVRQTVSIISDAFIKRAKGVFAWPSAESLNL